jgi:hypothetical protein
MVRLGLFLLIASFVLSRCATEVIGPLFWDSPAKIQARNEQAERDLHDLSIPPESAPDASWSFAYWIGVGKKNGDCVAADELMDKGAYAKQTVRQRGGRIVRTVYLSEYVSSCRHTLDNSIAQADLTAKKYCAFRTRDPRYGELCAEWENNRARYIADLNANNGPTFARYETYPYEGPQ